MIPKGFLISTNFRGCTSHFHFGHFYIVDFHSALTFSDRDLKIEGWVNIYNVKKSKTEMACAPPKSSRNPSTYRPNTTGVGWFFLFQQNMFWWDGHPSAHPFRRTAPQGKVQQDLYLIVFLIKQKKLGKSWKKYKKNEKVDKKLNYFWKNVGERVGKKL